MVTRLVLAGIGFLLAAAWLPLRLRYMRERSKPLFIPGVPGTTYLGGIVLFGGGGLWLLYLGFTKPLDAAAVIALIGGGFCVVLGLVVAGTWRFATTRRP